jgi:hypothetical protein
MTKAGREGIKNDKGKDNRRRDKYKKEVIPQ